MFRKFASLLVLLAASLPAAHAEIVKSAIVDCGKNGICLYNWPRLPTLPGWHTDEKVNQAMGDNGINVLIPDGATFDDADVILYAAATYRPRYQAENPTSKTLEAFIEDDKSQFVEKDENTVIAEVEPLTTHDGQKLRSFTFFRPKAKNWERVSYSQEGDFYIVFVLNAHSEEGYRKEQAVYDGLVRQYSEKP